MKIAIFLQKNIFFFLAVLISVNGFAQSKTITGQVVDQSSGEALSGVSVIMSGTSTATTTDDNGRYSILGRSGGTLVFTHINYTEGRLNIGSAAVYNIGLIPRGDTLSDVVVIGYGSVNRKDMTGSVSQVNVEDMAKAPVMSFQDALAGRVAGVQVISADGQPGSEDFSIVVRGTGSITQNTSPLFVVDGVAIEDFDPATLNMDDIEEFNVLKDASATAIYGARGANGVILIQTKKGKVGRPRVAYTGSFGFQDVTKRMDMMNPYEFVKYQLERNGYSEEIMRKYTPRDFPVDDTINYDPDGNTLEDYKNIRGINWQDLVFQRGATQIHNISLSGGSELTKYLASGSVYNMKGVLINSGSRRVTGRLSLDQTISNKFKAGANISYSDVQSFGQVAASNTGGAGHAFGYVMFSTWAFRPVTGRETLEHDVDDDFIGMELDPDEGPPTTHSYINPVQLLTNEDRKVKRTQLNINGYVNYSIRKDLTLRTTAAYLLDGGESTVFYNSKTTRGNPALSDRGVQGSASLSNTARWQSSTTLTYNKTFKKIHKLNGMIGVDFMERVRKGYGLAGYLIPFDDLGIIGMDNGLPSPNSVTYTDERLNSVFGRFNYDYRSRYLLTGTIRADGSSKFAPENRWGYFPSGAFAWRIKNEKFMKSVDAISDLKLRIGYGATGNNRVGDYAYMSTIAFSTASSYSFGNTEPIIGFAPALLGNRDLKWETSHQGNIGLDLSLLDDRIELVVDAYRKNTKDLLLYANIPYHLGFSRTYKNIGEIQNEGIEFTLNARVVEGRQFTWRSNFNISFNRNKIIALTNDQDKMLSAVTWDHQHNPSYLYTAEIGKPAAMFIGYVFDGIYQYSDFDQVGNNYVLKKGLPDNGGTVQPGSIKYKDLNGDGTVNQFDEAIIGNPMPKHIGGFSNVFDYKGFNLNIFFQWSYGNQLFNANRIYFEGGRPADNRNQFATYANRWTPDNPSNEHFRANGQGPAGRYSSKYIEDGSFLRLKTVALSYSIPTRIIKISGIRSLLLTATAQNLKTWTNYSGPDPEVSVRNTILTPGFDWSAYPRATILVFGVKANF